MAPYGAIAIWRHFRWRHMALSPYGAIAIWRHHHSDGAIWRHRHMAPSPYGAIYEGGIFQTTRIELNCLKKSTPNALCEKVLQCSMVAHSRANDFEKTIFLKYFQQFLLCKIIGTFDAYSSPSLVRSPSVVRGFCPKIPSSQKPHTREGLL